MPKVKKYVGHRQIETLSLLHTAVTLGDNAMAKSLLQHDTGLLMMKDSQGYTAVHRLFVGNHPVKSISRTLLLSSNQLEESIAEGVGLTHLHVASWFDDAEAAKKLLGQGKSHVDGRLKRGIEDEKLSKFEGCTALHLAVMNRSTNAAKVLFQWGANVFAKMPNSASAVSEILRQSHDDRDGLKMLTLFMQLLSESNDMQTLMWTEFPGMTMLHLACYSLDASSTKDLLQNSGIDVNARIDGNASIWPCCTPLHVLAKVFPTLASSGNSDMAKERKSKFGIIFKLLLADGANVTAADDNLYTPLQTAFNGLIDDYDFGHSILKHHRDFRLNPTDHHGLSYFHLACLAKDFASIGQLLRRSNDGGVDVNQPAIVVGRKDYDRTTPLHLVTRPTTAWISMSREESETALTIVDMLLNHGAESAPRDYYGNTPLHYAALYWYGTPREKLMRKLLGCDNEKYSNAKNRYGETPLELLLLNHAAVEELELLLKRDDYHMNRSAIKSDTGYLAMIFSSTCFNSTERKKIFKMIDFKKLLVKDTLGRNAIHNSVNGDCVLGRTEDFFAFIELLIDLGCDIDRKDRNGKTPLHLATQFVNVEAVCALLEHGADINVVDSTGKTAYSYIMEQAIMHHHSYRCECERARQIVVVCATLLKKYAHSKIFVNEVNANLQTRANQIFDLDSWPIDLNYYKQHRASKHVIIGPRNLKLGDFFCETGAISNYTSTMPIEREAISAFFGDERNFKNFHELQNIIKLQFRKATQRLPLMDLARVALEILVRCPIPYLCSCNVLSYLPNDDLKKLIRATTENRK